MNRICVVASQAGVGAHGVRRGDQQFGARRHPVLPHPVSSNLSSANSEIVRLWLDNARQSRPLDQYKRVRLLTDVLLDHLEHLNMRYPKGRELDRVTRDAIQLVLAELPEAWRPSWPHCGTVQEALDQMFELKGEIKRRALPGGLPVDWNWGEDAQP